ncbi:MAG: T9SS type A sorting domain-containing protein, partial [Flavobacteriales bacterium]|nr:T9SS type A sorting domain-containing protein [Flavobacteriales bacterium]
TNASMSTWPDLASLTVYPTPSEDVVNIVGNGFDNESPVTVRVRDGIGRITAVKTMPANAGQARWTLDASSWATGIYTVEGTQKDVRAVSRIVVTR